MNPKTSVSKRRGVEGISGETTTRYPQDVQCFTLNTPADAVEGNWMRLVAESQGMWVHVKGYAEGGENTLHRHLDEDHLFFVISGAAEFTLQDEITVEVGPLGGIFLPKKALYRFRAQPGETLWMIRVGVGDGSGPRVAGLSGGREDHDPETQALWDRHLKTQQDANSPGR